MINHQIPQRREGVRCTDCGPSLGTSANIGQGGLRCSECGKFAEPCPTYCAKHEIHWGGLTGYDHCPRCREVAQMEAEQMERTTRDPLVEPY